MNKIKPLLITLALGFVAVAIVFRGPAALRKIILGS